MVKWTNDNLVKGNTNNPLINDKYDTHFQKTTDVTANIRGIYFYAEFYPSVNHGAQKKFNRARYIKKLSKRGREFL